MLRFQGAGLLHRNAHLRGYLPLTSAGCRRTDPTRWPARAGSCHVAHQTTQASQDTAKGSPRRSRQRLRKLRKPDGASSQEASTAKKADGGFVPMSDYEYERSLWEAGREPENPTEPPSESTQPLEEHHPEARESASSSEQKDASKGKEVEANPQLIRSKIRKSKFHKGEPVSRHRTTPISIPFKAINKDVHMNVPRLAHNLEKALFNPGVYHLQDPRSKVFNFDPYLTSIMPVDEFDFDALREYVSSSKDKKLHAISKEHGKKYCGSTSSMTSVLSHFHYLISQWRKPAFPSITGSFVKESDNFTQLTRAPASTFLHHNDGVYAMDSDREFDFGRENVLMMLGHSLEKLLTLPPEEFEKYRRTRSHLIPQETRDAGADAYHYGTIGKFMLRSQLDAKDARLPGSGVFDIKTRAVFPIRIDLDNYADHVGYEIWNRFGQYESYEREYYDLIRAAFLKYSLQARMGRMDGCFVAYHNTRRIFGFQYVSISEMDQALHGTADPKLGDAEFRLSVTMLQKLLDKATAKYPERKLQITVETRDTNPPVLLFFARPVAEEEVRASEAKAISMIDKAQRDISAAQAKVAEAVSDSAVGAEQPETALGEEAEEQEEEEGGEEEQVADDSSAPVDAELVWEEMIAKVEEVIEDEALGVGSVRDAVQGALHENELFSFENLEEQHPSLDTLVEALVKERSASRDSQESTADVGTPSDVKAITDEKSAVVETSTADQTPAADSTTAPTRELKELILKFSKAVDLNAKQARGFERALADLLSKAKSQLDTPAEEVTSGDSSTESSGAPQSTATEDLTSEDKAGSPGAEDATKTAKNGQEAPQSYPIPSELYGLVLSVTNEQDGKSVKRVEVRPGQQLRRWNVNYTIHEMDSMQKQSLYPAMKKRRHAVFGPGKKKLYDRQKLMAMSESGAHRRKKETDMAKKIHVAWSEESLPTSSQFTQGAKQPGNGQK